jgi:hypothetical protein
VLVLVIKEFVQGDEVGNYMVQKVFLDQHITSLGR